MDVLILAEILEARITENFSKAAFLEGTVHSIFKSVINVSFEMPEHEKRLITIIPPNIPGIPDSLVVSNDYFKKILILPIGAKVIKEYLTFNFQTIDEHLYGTDKCLIKSNICCDINLNNTKYYDKLRYIIGNMNRFIATLQEFRMKNSRKDGFTHFSEEKRKKLKILVEQFCDKLFEADEKGLQEVVKKCVGTGPGLTPSTDDILVGIMAVFSGILACGCPAGTKWNTIRDGNRVLNRIIDIVNFNLEIEGLTTDVSRKYLQCALEGRFSDVLLNLVTVLFSEKRYCLDPLIEAIANVGSTSGMDMLLGVEIACRKYKLYVNSINCK